MLKSSFQKARRPRLEFLDGIRGLAALYVALYHASLFSGYGVDEESYSPLMGGVIDLLSFGPYAVAVFIVLSGFVLTLPVARTSERTLRGGFWSYLGRRAHRILPPYYVALAFFLLLIAVVPLLQVQQGTAWDSKIPVTWGAIWSHLLLLHNLGSGWSLKIDGPMWSVATEWQIYFVFPLLLFIWRRFGLLTSVVFAVIIGLIPEFTLPDARDLSWLHPWFLGLFAFGMFGAAVVFSPLPVWQRLRDRLPWCALALTAAGLGMVTLLASRVLALPLYASETIVGGSVTVIIIYLALLEVRGLEPPPVLRLLSSPKIVFLGAFSYSIYLFHSPLLGLFNLLTLDLRLGSDLRLIVMLFIAVPLSLLAAYGFYVLVERHFLSGHQRQLGNANPIRVPQARLELRR